MRYVVVLLLVLAACRPDANDPVAGEEYLNMSADQVLFEIRHFMSRDGVRQALLLADTAFLHEESGQVELRGVNLTLFGSQGEERATLTSRQGELNTRTQAMIARGDAVLITVEGARRIETEELHYDPQQDRIWSDSATTMHEGETVVRGTGFTADGQLRNLTVTQPTGRFEGVRIEF